MHTYVYVCIRIDVSTYLCIYMYTYTFADKQLDTYMHTYVCICICIYTHTPPNTHADTFRLADLFRSKLRRLMLAYSPLATSSLHPSGQATGLQYFQEASIRRTQHGSDKHIMLRSTVIAIVVHVFVYSCYDTCMGI